MMRHMRVINQTTEVAPLDAVRPHPKNPRQGDTGAIHESIQANGFYGTIIAQKSTGYILAGNHRWQAALQAEAKEIPVTWVDVDDDHALRILLADNRTNDLAAYDDAVLAEILEGLAEADGELSGTGYSPDEVADLVRRVDEVSFLDDLMSDSEGEGHSSRAGDNPPGEDYVQLSFTITPEERARFMRAAKAAKAEGAESNPEALMIITSEYLRSRE